MDPYYPWLIKQYLGARSTKLLQPRVPRINNLLRALTPLHPLERVRIHEQPQILIHLPIVRIQLPQRQCHFDSSEQRSKQRAISDDDVHAATLLIFEDRRVRCESQRHKPHTGNATLVQILSESISLNPRRAHNFERRVRATTNRNIRRLKQTHTRIECRFSKAAHVWRRIHPREVSLVKPHRSPPALHLDHAQICADVSLAVEELG